MLYGLPFAGYVPSALNEGLATARGLRLAGRFGAGVGRGKLPVLRQMRGFGGLMAGTASYLTIPAATAIFNWVTANRKAK